MRAFWDASAVVPLCFPQVISQMSQQLRRQYRDLVVWWGTLIEVRCALARLSAAGTGNGQPPETALARLALLRESWREVLPTERVRSLAEQLAGQHHLRSGDVFQLAAALDWCDQRPQNRPFICFDRRLAQAARRVGFAVPTGL